jgi:hypothetical protein
LIDIALIIFLAVVFAFLYRKDRLDKKREEEMYLNSLDQIDANTEKFYDMVGKMQIKHFENLEKHTAKFLKLLENRPVQVKEEVRKLESIDTNDISEEVTEDPFTEENHIPIMKGMNIQFEGEESIHPVNIE